MLLLFAKDKIFNIKVIVGYQMFGFIFVMYNFPLLVASSAHHIIHID